MKGKKTFLKLLVCMVAFTMMFSSCFTTKVGMITDDVVVDDFPAFRDRCIGMSHNQIVTTLGAPQRQMTDGAGGSILVYENTSTTTVSEAVATAYNVNYIKGTYTPGMKSKTTQVSSTEYMHFFVNQEGQCYEVKTNLEMKHVEKSEPYLGKYRKFSAKRTWGLVFSTLAGIVAIPWIVDYFQHL